MNIYIHVKHWDLITKPYPKFYGDLVITLFGTVKRKLQDDVAHKGFVDDRFEMHFLEWKI